MVYFKKAARRLRFLWILFVIFSLMLPYLLSALKHPIYAGTLPDTTPDVNAWVTNAQVLTTKISGDIAYLGGSFTTIGPYVGAGAPVGADGNVVATFPKVEGVAEGGDAWVVSSISDGNDGWYIGGYFDSVGGVARNNLAHILSDGSVDALWDPNPNNDVDAMVLSGTTLYVGGDFHTIGGQSRNHIAALDVSEGSTGTATSWNPNAGNYVESMFLSGTTLYVGGGFATIGGQTRNKIAALDTTTDTNNATLWDPGLGGTISYIHTIAETGGTVYVGGIFSNIGGQARNRIAAISAATGAATDWNPNSNGEVRSLVVDAANSLVYVGGIFTTIGGESRSNIAALNTGSNTATAWNPGADSTVRQVLLDGTTLYVSGDITNIGGQNRNYVGSLSTSSNEATSWNPSAGYIVLSLAKSGSNIYVGGEFESLGGVTRNYAAAIDLTTGEATDWNPNADNSVETMTISGSRVYAGGDFHNIGGQVRNHIAALDLTTGAVDVTWNPNADDLVMGIAVNGSDIFAGGYFANIGGQGRNYIAKLNNTDGNADLVWNANITSIDSGLVKPILINGTKMYFGGTFSTVGGSTRNNIVSVNLADASLDTGWLAAGTNLLVQALATDGTTLYIGGNFSTVNSVSKSYLAALDISNGSLNETWNPDPDSYLMNLILNDGNLYIAGDFYSLEGGTVSTRYLAAVDPAGTGSAFDWTTSPDYDVKAIAVSSSKLVAGGPFRNWGNGSHTYLGVFDIGDAPAEPTPTSEPIATPTPTPTTAPNSTPSNPNSPVNPVCNPPSSAPNLFQIKTAINSATLYFSPGGEPVSSYQIMYGTTPQANQFGVNFIKPYTGAVILYTVNGLSPFQDYYFRVQALSSCNASSAWSNILGAADYRRNTPLPVNEKISFCNQTCFSAGYSCASGLSCLQQSNLMSSDKCRNPKCPESLDCLCSEDNLPETVSPIPTEIPEEVTPTPENDSILPDLPDFPPIKFPEDIEVVIETASSIAATTTESVSAVVAVTATASLATSALVNIGTISQAVTLAQAPIDVPSSIKFFTSVKEILAGLFLPFFGFLRKKQKTLGIVIDSVTGKPIPSTYLVLSSLSGNLFTTTTNQDGRFFFPKVKPDTYKLKAETSGFKFPSEVLTVNQNSNFTRIYQGEDLPFREEMPFSNLAVPLDPKKSLSVLQKINLRLKSFLSYIFVRYFYSISLVFFGLAIFAYLFSKSNLQLLLAALSLIIIFFNIYKDLKARQNMGMVVDGDNKPLVGLNLELYRNGEFYSSAVTNSGGRFIFAPEEGSYSLKINNFQKEISIDNDHPWITEKIVLSQNL